MTAAIAPLAPSAGIAEPAFVKMRSSAAATPPSRYRKESVQAMSLARPHLVRGLKDSYFQVQLYAAQALCCFGTHEKWAVGDLLELANSTNLGSLSSAAMHALNILGTNSWSLDPKLKEMLAEEKDEQRRKVIAHAIDYTSHGPPVPQKD